MNRNQPQTAAPEVSFYGDLQQDNFSGVDDSKNKRDTENFFLRDD
jgi:hypothetical protein